MADSADLVNNIALTAATGSLRDRLIELAVKHEQTPGRPCCDGDTTLADWIDSGLIDA